MAKLALICCLWLAIVKKTFASSPPGFDSVAARSIDYFNGDYLYE
jgi:hypothetical protein